MKRTLAMAVLLLASCESALGAETLPRTAEAEPMSGLAQLAEPASEPIVGLLVARHSVDIRTMAPGRVRELHVSLGDRVPSGSPLVSLENPDTTRALAIARARTHLARARVGQAVEQRRYRDEQADRTTSLGDFISDGDRREATHHARIARHAADVARAEVVVEEAEAARLRARLDGLSLSAPFDGTIAAVLKSPGDLVQQNEPILRINSTNAALRFVAPAVVCSDLQIGDVVLFSPAVGGDTLEARIESLSPEVDMAGMLLVEAALEAAPQSIRAGTRGHVTLPRT